MVARVVVVKVRGNQEVYVAGRKANRSQSADNMIFLSHLHSQFERSNVRGWIVNKTMGKPAVYQGILSLVSLDHISRNWYAQWLQQSQLHQEEFHVSYYAL